MNTTSATLSANATLDRANRKDPLPTKDATLADLPLYVVIESDTLQILAIDERKGYAMQAFSHCQNLRRAGSSPLRIKSLPYPQVCEMIEKQMGEATGALQAWKTAKGRKYTIGTADEKVYGIAIKQQEELWTDLLDIADRAKGRKLYVVCAGGTVVDVTDNHHEAVEAARLLKGKSLDGENPISLHVIAWEPLSNIVAAQLDNAAGNELLTVEYSRLWKKLLNLL